MLVTSLDVATTKKPTQKYIIFPGDNVSQLTFLDNVTKHYQLIHFKSPSKPKVKHRQIGSHSFPIQKDVKSRQTCGVISGQILNHTLLEPHDKDVHKVWGGWTVLTGNTRRGTKLNHS